MDDWALDYIRLVVEQLNITPTELAKRAGVASSTLTRPLNAGNGHPFKISRRTLERIREASGIPFPSETAPTEVAESPPVLAGGDLTVIERHPESVIPPHAGNGHQSIAIPHSMARSLSVGDPAALSMSFAAGDCMDPIVSKHDAVIFDRGQTDLGYDGVYVLRIDGKLSIKRISRSGKEGLVMVSSDNKLYPPFAAEITTLVVLGRVTWIGKVL